MANQLQGPDDYSEVPTFDPSFDQAAWRKEAIDKARASGWYKQHPELDPNNTSGGPNAVMRQGPIQQSLLQRIASGASHIVGADGSGGIVGDIFGGFKDAATLPHDVYAGKQDMNTDQGVGRAINMASMIAGAGAPAAMAEGAEGRLGMAGGKPPMPPGGPEGPGGFTARPGDPNYHPYLKPAIKMGDNVVEGAHHDNTFMQMTPEQKAAFNANPDQYLKDGGFVNDKRQFMNRQDALQYAKDNDMIKPEMATRGDVGTNLTSEMLKDAHKGPIPPARAIDQKMSFEVAPGQGTPFDAKYGDRFRALSPEGQAAVTKEVGSHAYEAAGGNPADLVHGTGAWKDQSNPAIVAHVNGPVGPQNEIGQKLADMLHQHEVWNNHNSFPRGGVATDFHSPDFKDPAIVQQFWQKLQAADPTGRLEGYQPIVDKETGNPGFRTIVDHEQDPKGTATKVQAAILSAQAPGGPIQQAMEAHNVHSSGPKQVALTKIKGVGGGMWDHSLDPVYDAAISKQEQMASQPKAAAGMPPSVSLSPEEFQKLDATAKWAKFGQQYPPTGEPVVTPKTDMKTKAPILDENGVQKTYLAKNNPEETLQFAKDRNAVKKDMEKNGYTPTFDPSQRQMIPAGNFDHTGFDPRVDNVPTTAKAQATHQALASDPSVMEKGRAALQEGMKDPNSGAWYAMKQLHDAFVHYLGPEEASKQFRARFSKQMAATTAGASPEQNLMNTAYANHMHTQGKPAVEQSHSMPYPVGGDMVGGNMEMANKMKDVESFGADNPKRGDFQYAIEGNENRPVIDKQMSAGMGVKSSSGKPLDAPPNNAYGYWADPWHRLAAEMGITPTNAQGFAWHGFGGKAGKPLISTVNEAIERTHRLTGRSRADVLENSIVRGRDPLYSSGVPLPTQGQRNDQ